jgi:vacuolar protein sorting-associated protein 13A/C
VGVHDWSSQMKADTNIDLFINVFNFSKSAWEPLVEPWQVGFHMSKVQNPDRLEVDLFSRRMLEITLTSASIALALKAAQFLQQDEDVLSKPRGVDTPYRIRNYTGYDLDVWADERSDGQSSASKVADGEEVPWRFEDWEKMRENLALEGTKGLLGVRLKDCEFEPVSQIPINREGERIYNLRPKKDEIRHRLLVEVVLGTDNVKYVTFRSPLLVENKTQIPIELGVYDVEQGHLVKIEKIPPGEARPAPIGFVYEHSLLVRPDQGFGYTWSSERMYWRDLLKRPTRTMTCKGEDGQRTPSFFFQMSANYDKANPLTR